MNFALDFRPASSSNFFLRGVSNSFSHYEYRRELFYAVGDNEIERNLKDRFESERILQLAGGGEHIFASAGVFDYRVTGSYADYDRPDEYNTDFVVEDVDFAPNVTPTSIDPDNVQANPLNEDLSGFTLNEQEPSDNFNREAGPRRGRQPAAPLPARTGFAGFVKVGAKFRNKQMEQDDNARVFEPEDDIFLSNFVDQTFDPGRFLRGQYTNGPFVNPGAAKGFTGRFPFESEFDFETDAADFSATENVIAAYPGTISEETRAGCPRFEPMNRLAGQKRGPRRRTRRRRDERVREASPFPGDAIEVRRADGSVPIDAGVGERPVVRNGEKDVRALDRRGLPVRAPDFIQPGRHLLQRLWVGGGEIVPLPLVCCEVVELWPRVVAELRLRVLIDPRSPPGRDVLPASLPQRQRTSLLDQLDPPRCRRAEQRLQHVSAVWRAAVR